MNDAKSILSSGHLLAQLRFLIAARPGQHPKTGLPGREEIHFKNHTLFYYNPYCKWGARHLIPNVGDYNCI